MSFAEVAQSVEQGTENPRVGSSILSLGTILKSSGDFTLELLFFWMNFMNAFVLNDQLDINKLDILCVE